MLILDVEHDRDGSVRRSGATVEWEDNDFATQRLFFEVDDSARPAATGGDHLLTTSFPLAVLHRERRLAIEAPLCPMLVDGLFLVHAWWRRWGGLAGPVPRIESTVRRSLAAASQTSTRALSFLSGGVDSLHVLMRNRACYGPDDPAYIRDAVFVHGLDIGKRARALERERADRVFNLLQPLAEEMGTRLLRGYTNLRHLPSAPDFWNLRYSGAATAGFGHFAANGPGFVFMGGPTDIQSLSPLGLHPAVDVNYSSQQVRIIHDGARFSRLDKMRQLAEQWPAALNALRVCPANVGDRLNCGECDKCLHTRLELLAVGCDYSRMFGETRMSPELLEIGVEISYPYQAANYRNVLRPLRERGLGELAAIIERKLAAYEAAAPQTRQWVNREPRAVPAIEIRSRSDCDR